MKIHYERYVLLIFSVALVGLAFLAWFAVVSMQNLISINERIARSSLIINTSEELMRSSIDMETGQRGYIITGKREFLDPYQSAINEIPEKLITLDSLTQGLQFQSEKVNEIEDLLTAQKHFFVRVLVLRDSSFEKAQALVITGEGKRITDKVRTIISDLQGHENQVRSDAYVLNDSNVRKFQAAFFTLVLIVFLIIGYLAVAINRVLHSRKIINDRLQQSIEEATDLYENAPCGYLSVNSTLYLAKINATLLSWLGYTKQEVIGKMKYEDLLTPQSRVNFLLSFEKDFAKYKSDGFVNNLEFEFMRKDGSFFPAVVNSMAVFDKHGDFSFSRSTVFDNTARMAEENKFKGLVESSPDALVIVNSNGIIKIINAKCESIFGYSRNEVIGQPVEILIPERFSKRHPAHRAGYNKNPSARPMGKGMELVAKRKDGSEFPAEISLSPVESGTEVLVTAAIRDITDRKLAEEKLRFLATIANNIQDPIISTSTNFNITSWNKPAEKLFEWSAEEAIGKTTLQVLQPEFQGLSRQEIIDILYRDGFWQGEVLYYTKSRVQISTLVTVSAIKDSHGTIIGNLILARDITEQKQNQERISYLAGLVEDTREAMYAVTENFVIKTWNNGAEQLYGHTSEEAIGKPVFEVIRSSMPLSERMAIRDSIIKHGQWQGELEHIRKDGTTIYILGSTSATFDQDKKLNGFVSIAQDITARKKAEIALNRINKELESFTYSVSHDLRAPLRSIIGYSEILKEDYAPLLGDEGKRISNVIIINAKRMGQLIDDLLDFSRMGRKEMMRTNIDMRKIIDTTVAEITSAMSAEQLSIHIDKIFTCNADPAMLKQVWSNLISNAIKYSSKRDHIDITIGSTKQNGIITYFIKDNGAGFDMKYVKKLFGVFQRLHKMNEYEGTGVGLALVKAIINRHGGNVWAHGEIDKGATFYFTIPTLN
jgi:PAS domain S-box-containing protein